MDELGPNHQEPGKSALSKALTLSISTIQHAWHYIKTVFRRRKRMACKCPLLKRKNKEKRKEIYIYIYSAYHIKWKCRAMGDQLQAYVLSALSRNWAVKDLQLFQVIVTILWVSSWVLLKQIRWHGSVVALRKWKCSAPQIASHIYMACRSVPSRRDLVNTP